MFSILRITLAEKAIRKFLGEYLPTIGLGEFEILEQSDFSEAVYFVKTTKGKYKIYFGYHYLKAKEFQLELMDGEWGYECITFTITGKYKFKIYPKKFSIMRDDERQVTRLINGTSQIYPMGKKCNEVDYYFIEYKKPIKEAKFLNLSQIIEVTKDYI